MPAVRESPSTTVLKTSHFALRTSYFQNEPLPQHLRPPARSDPPRAGARAGTAGRAPSHRSQQAPVLKGRALAMLFEKPSLRTRVSFEQAMNHLGGHAVVLGRDEVGLGKRESVADVARVLGGMVEAIAARVFSHAHLEELAAHAGVPVVNMLSDVSHPAQALADAMTLADVAAGGPERRRPIRRGAGRGGRPTRGVRGRRQQRGPQSDAGVRRAGRALYVGLPDGLRAGRRGRDGEPRRGRRGGGRRRAVRRHVCVDG